MLLRWALAAGMRVGTEAGQPRREAVPVLLRRSLAAGMRVGTEVGQVGRGAASRGSARASSLGASWAISVRGRGREHASLREALSAPRCGATTTRVLMLVFGVGN